MSESDDKLAARRFMEGHEVKLTPAQREIVEDLIRGEGPPQFNLKEKVR